MRFLSRATGGFAILTLCLTLLTLGGARYLGCVSALSGVPGFSCALDQGDGRDRARRERVFAVATDRISIGAAAPEIRAFGEIRSGRSLELRAATAGRLVAISERFRDGEIVAEGEQLFLIDPADAADREADAAAALVEAEAELEEARIAADLAAQEHKAAIEQRRLRAQALERRRGLEERGFSTAEELETAELALADAERAVITRDQARAAAVRRAAQAEQQLTRARIALEDATRDMADTEFTAPFAGILQDVEATLGRLVAVNESLGALIDPTALEAAFRVTDAEFARLLDEEGRLLRLEAEVVLDLGPRAIRAPATLVRISATAQAEEGGRRIFARLRQGAETTFRPGDFVSLRIAEPALDGVAEAPAAALDAEDRILILTQEGRLREQPVEVVRRQGETVLLRGAPEGAVFVKKRRPGLGEGVKARSSSDDEAISRSTDEPRLARRGEGGSGAEDDNGETSRRETR